MAESIFVRVQRVLSANVDVVVEAAERASGTGLMREAIRDLDRLHAELSDQADAAGRRMQVDERRGRAIEGELETLADQARFALSKDREDLATAAIARQIALEAEAAALARTRAAADDAARRLADGLAALAERRRRMTAELTQFEADRAAARADDRPSPADRVARQMAQAEDAFDRARAAAGTTGGVRPDADVAARMAEIAALQRDDAVAARLAALRTGVAALRKKARG